MVLAALLASLASPDRAAAREYAVEISVADEQELRELYYEGILDEEEFRILLLLMETPVDLNRSEKSDLYQLPGVTASLADRIVEERIVDGPYLLLADLINRVDGVTWRLLAQIEPFLVVSMPSGTKPALRGKVQLSLFKEFDGCPVIENDYAARSHYRCQLGYENWPGIGLSGGAQVFGWLDFGLAGSLQEGLKYAEYEPSSQDIYASYGSPLFRPHSVYLRIRRPGGEVVAGSYFADFGRGLVFSNSSGGDRHGFTIRKLLGSSTEERIRPHSGLFGVAARAHPVSVGRADFDLSVFGSVRNHDLYSSYLGLAHGEQLDPVLADVDSPRVWVDGQRASSLTLPSVFRVALGGGNVTLRFNRRTHVGFTGYGAYVDRSILPGVSDPNTFLIERGWPSSPGFGSVGLDGAIGFGLIDFSGEVGVWLDGDPALAMIFRARLEPAWGEFILSARHYGVGYANPFAKGTANPDQLVGYTDRNEQGVRFEANIEPFRKRLRARARIDLSHNILLDTYDLDLRGSLRGRPVEFLQLSVWTRFTDQNLALSGRDQVYSGGFENDYYGEVYGTDLDRLDPELLEDLEDALSERAGQKVTLGGSARLDQKKVGDVTVTYQRTWTDNEKRIAVSPESCQPAMQQGHRLRVAGRVTPTKTTTLKSAFTVYDGDVQGGRSGSGGAYGDTALYAHLQIEQKVGKVLKFRLRGGLGRRLPDPPGSCDSGTVLDASEADGTRLLRSPVLSPIADSQRVYEPTDYQLRHFGHITFSMQVKF